MHYAIRLTLTLACAISGLLHSAEMAFAAPPILSNGPAWVELNPGQRSALQPLQPQWVSLTTESKLKWIEIAARFPKMTPEEQDRIQQRMTDWAKLTPAERDRARIQFQFSKQLSPEERQARWAAYQSLGQDEKRELAKRAENKRRLLSRNGSKTTKRPPFRPTTDHSPPTPTANASANAPLTATQKYLPPPENPGASTPLLSKPPTSPSFLHPGMPRIPISAGHVDTTTLLPVRKPQTAIPDNSTASFPQPRQ